jgi:hypothetical protein
VAKSPKAKPDNIPELKVAPLDGETPQQTIARVALTPALTGGRFMAELHKKAFPDAELTHFVVELKKQGDMVKGGDLSRLEEMLTAQAHALDGLFYQMVRVSHANREAGYLPASETYMKLGLRAQSQCRATAESIAAIKTPASVAFVRQANIAHGPQQVNNGVPAPSRARENEIEQSKLLEASDGERLDSGAAGAAIRSDQALAPMGAIDRAEDDGGES